MEIYLFIRKKIPILCKWNYLENLIVEKSNKSLQTNHDSINYKQL